MNQIATEITMPENNVAGIIESGLSGPLGRLGSLETRIATSDFEINAAQKLRFQIFAEELGAKLPPKAMLAKRDFDNFDDNCDHLLVIDNDIIGPTQNKIVGTYRLMRQSKAEDHGGFYSQGEFNVTSLITRHPKKRFVELGRSCVLPQYRTRRIVELLWQGIWAYVCQFKIDVMFGCASFHGTVPAEHAQALSFLYHHARASKKWSVSAQRCHAHSMDLMPVEAVNTKVAVANMPPLIKGYLRLGAKVAPKAAIDYAFNTTDVLIVLPVSAINDRYINHYGADASRYAA